MAWDDEDEDFDDASPETGGPRDGVRRGDDSRDEDPDPRDFTPDDCTTVRCTFCGKFIFDDADQCPYCKHWQLQEERIRKPHWFVVTVIICVAALALGGTIVWALWGVL